MLTKKITNTDFVLLKEDDTIHKAIQTMASYEGKHVCARIADTFGIFSTDTLLTLNSEATLLSIKHHFQEAKATAENHIWQTINSLQQCNTDILPVVDKQDNYIGTVNITDIINQLMEIFPIANGGAILQLSMKYRDYSLTEIANIVESTNTKITLLTVNPIEVEDQIHVTFSIDKTDANDIIQTLERHNYTVNAWYINKSNIDHLLEERYSAFLQYINV